MVTINGNLVTIFVFALLFFACGGNTPTQNDTPPPLPNNFEGFYSVDNTIKPDSAMYIAIKKNGTTYQLIKYTNILSNKLYNRGAVNAAFVNESDHRIIANGGHASVSYTAQDTSWRYVNKPDDFKLRRICDFTAKDTSAASVEKMLDENGALGR